LSIEARVLAINEIIALASLAAALIAIGTNVGSYIHLCSTMNSRFDSVDRKFESVERRVDTLLGKVIEIDNRLTRVEERMGIRP
jgi:hypothetical protein